MKEIVLINRIEENIPHAMHCKPLSAKASTSRTFWKVKERDFPLDNPQNLELKKSDYVEVEIPPGQAVASAFMLFILPLLIFLLVSQLSSPLGQTLQIVLGALSFALGFLIPGLLKRLGRKEKFPVILRKLEQEEARESLQCNIGCDGCGGCG